MKAGGYKTALIGKWHLGEEADYYPEHQGFDLNVAGSGHGHPPSYFSPYKLPNLPDGPQGEYLTDRLTDEALKFIEQSKDVPFFLYLPHYAVHTPIQAKAGIIGKYKAKAAKRSDAGQLPNNPVYGAMIESLDENVGRIMDKLIALGLETNTVIFFTSDNGGLSGYKGAPTSNLPLRAGKGWPYEGGVREPLIVKWPGVTKPGGVNNAPVISTDYYPTLLRIAGLSPLPEQHPDGRSIVPLLQGGTTPERPLFWHYPHYSPQGGAPNGAVRLGGFKLIEWYEDMRAELYNLNDDPGEHSDLAAKMPAKADELRKLLHDWRDAVKAQMPVPNPKYKAGGSANKQKGDEQ
jgi:arylsulfatase A-like enzyme